MKTLTMFKRPREICYSKNAISFGFYIGNYNHQSALRERLKIEIYVETGEFGSNNFQLKKILDKSFNSLGISEFRIDSILRTYVEEEMMDISKYRSRIAHKSSRRYRVFANHYNKYVTGIKDMVYQGTVVNGGVELQYTEQMKSYLELLFDRKSYLSNLTSIEVVKLNQGFFLSNLGRRTVSDANQKHVIQVYDDMNILQSEEEFSHGRIMNGMVIHNYIKMNDYIGAIYEKRSYRIDIVQRSSDGSNSVTIASQVVIVVPDRLEEEREVCMHYYNSLGGISSIIMQKGELIAQYEGMKVTIADTRAYLNSSYLKPSRRLFNTKRSNLEKIETGFILKERILSYQDLLLSKNVYIEKKKAGSWDIYLENFVIEPSDVSLLQAGDQVANLQIKIEGREEEVFSKKMEDQVGLWCDPPLFMNIVQVDYNRARVYYQFPEGVLGGLLRYGKGNSADANENFSIGIENNFGMIEVPLMQVVDQNNYDTQPINFWLRSNCREDMYSSYMHKNKALSFAAQLQIPDLVTNIYYSQEGGLLLFNNKSDIREYIVNPNPLALSSYTVDLPMTTGNQPGKAGTRGGELWREYTAGNSIRLYYKPAINEGVEKFTIDIKPNYLGGSNNHPNPSGEVGYTSVDIYIEVKPAVVVPGGGGSYSGPLFVRLIETDTEVYTETEEVPVLGKAFYKRIDANYRAEYYSDPHGVNPVDLSGSNIVIKYKKVRIDHVDDITTEVSYTILGNGTYNVLDSITKSETIHVGQSVEDAVLEGEITEHYELEESPEYNVS